jgi:acid phosphatase
MVSGNFSFTAADILNIPGLCGYESMIVGRLSPWCSIFNDEENKNYEYSQDLQYYYGPGPGSAKPNQQLFYPFLQGLLDLLMEGPGQQGVAANGSAFTVPNLIMGFWNDNQIAEFTAAMGLFDDQEPLPLDHIPDGYIYNIANIIPMRGTVTFEVLNCEGSAPPPSSSATAGNGGSTSTSSSKGSATVSNPSSTGPPSSSLGSVSSSSIIGSETTTSGSVKTSTVTVTTTASDCVPTTAFPTSYFKRSLPQQPNTNSTYLRILLNDAVYVIPSCQNGPGNSCLLSQYAAVIHDKYSAAGTFNEFCNVTTDAPNNANGATFFTNLTLNYLTPLSPFSDTF